MHFTDNSHILRVKFLHMTKWSITLIAVVSVITFLCAGMATSEIDAETQTENQEIDVDGLLESRMKT